MHISFPKGKLTRYALLFHFYGVPMPSNSERITSQITFRQPIIHQKRKKEKKIKTFLRFLTIGMCIEFEPQFTQGQEGYSFVF